MDVQFCTSLILVTHLLCLEACLDVEYEINGECCPRCGPGYRIFKHCTLSTSTSCVPCAEGTYMDDPNGLSHCFPCRTCDSGSNLMIKERCTYIKNTVCSCAAGYYCTHFRDEDCDTCQKHSVSPPGFMVTQAGTETTDTKYVPCSPGTFSTGQMSVFCKPWTNCSESGETEAEPGTATSDAVCKATPTDNHFHPVIIAVLILVPLLLIISLPVAVWKMQKGRRNAADKQQEETNDYYAVPVCETNMVEPIQETTQNSSAPTYQTV